MLYQTRIVIADSDTRSLKRVKGLLQNLGYTVLGEAKDGLSALTMVRRVSPDLVILDAKLPVMDAWEVAQIIESNRLAPVLLIVQYGQGLERFRESPLITPLVKPINEANLHIQMELALSRFEQVTELEKEIRDLKESLEVRKIVDKAKGILMQQRGMTEDAAFRYIQQLSMNKRISKKAVAEAILLMSEGDKV